MKIVKHVIIMGDSHTDLTNKIAYHIEDGWQPKGNFVMSKNCFFYQAMVKREEKVRKAFTGPK